MLEKELLRKKMKRRLDTQKISERRKKSRVIRDKILRRGDFLDSRCLMLYVSRGTKEVDTGFLIKKALQMGKKVVLPVTQVSRRSIQPVRVKNVKKDLVKGPYGIYEPKGSGPIRPVKAKDIDMVLVPGLAFDRDNNRLGHGKGYYDRFLKRLPADTPKIGLGFDIQVLKKIPFTPSDFPLTEVITN